MCEATDWEARLRGEDGYLSSYIEGHDGAERAVTGSAGTAIVTTTDSGASILVMRWDDTVDKYFTCEVELEDSEVALVAAFTAACEAARPAWFPVG